jgi:hypothetical protein
VQIDNQNSPDIVPRSVARSHDPRIAHRHLIALPARLALARWTRGGDIPHTPGQVRDMTHQAEWYGRLQHDFQSWLEAGGFHQAEPGQGIQK